MIEIYKYIKMDKIWTRLIPCLAVLMNFPFTESGSVFIYIYIYIHLHIHDKHECTHNNVFTGGHVQLSLVVGRVIIVM